MLNEIAKRVKKVRDASFTEKNAKGEIVNRTEGLASVGSAAAKVRVSRSVPGGTSSAASPTLQRNVPFSPCSGG